MDEHAPKSRIAVLTGDIVGSTALDRAALDHAMRALEDCARDQAQWMGAPLHFTRHRGDGWQVVCARPALALRSALAFRASLRIVAEDIDSTIGIAVGPAPATALPDDLNAASGPAFTASGRVLEALRALHDRDGLRMGYGPKAGAATYAASHLADHFASGWTSAQAEAIRPLLTPATKISYTQVAKRLGKSRQSVTKSAEAAGWRRLALVLPRLEQELDELYSAGT